jgi:phytoene dehydrogenase-like protein
MIYDAVIVGGGIAGLTAAAYLCNSGYQVVVCEKEKKVGGLVNSFHYKGFTFDGGIRAIENSGIVMPMLRQLGLHIDFVDNLVSIGIEKEVVRLVSEDSLQDYQALLVSQFPESSDDIAKIINDIKRIMGYMDVLYGIDNPLFLDLKKDKEYLYKTILPWLFKFIFTIKKIQKLNTPIDEYLQDLTCNQVLIDMIAQHFFHKTPAFFALSYFSLYLDYQYPKGGTGSIIEKLAEYIVDHNGEICKETQICSVNPQMHQLTDTQGNHFNYKKLIWASDLKKLYKMIDIDSITDKKTKQRILKQKATIMDKVGGDSIFTLYITADLDKSFFEEICSPHFFYTPLKKGMFNIDLNSLKDKTNGEFTTDKQAIIDWIIQFYKLTTYEISLPVMRDENLAPQGKTGLIISTLLDYSLMNHISNMGWYNEFKDLSAEAIIRVLDLTIFPGMKAAVTDQFSSTPLTLEKRTGNSEGAITGWAFTNSYIPAVTNMTKVAQSVLTPIPDVFQAGQWTFSPSGLPISILTGKLAADKVKKQIK